MLMILPPPCATMCGRAWRQVRYILLTLMSISRSQAFSPISSGPPGSTMPTLLCSTSIRPYLVRQASTISTTSTLDETSVLCTVHSPPSSPMMPAVFSTASGLMSTAKTLAPSRAKLTAVALPFPQPGPIEPAPVTIATLSSKRLAIFPSPKRQRTAARRATVRCGHIS